MYFYVRIIYKHIKLQTFIPPQVQTTYNLIVVDRMDWASVNSRRSCRGSHNVSSCSIIYGSRLLQHDPRSITLSCNSMILIHTNRSSISTISVHSCFRQSFRSETVITLWRMRIIIQIILIASWDTFETRHALR